MYEQFKLYISELKLEFLLCLIVFERAVFHSIVKLTKYVIEEKAEIGLFLSLPSQMARLYEKPLALDIGYAEYYTQSYNQLTKQETFYSREVK